MYMSFDVNFSDSHHLFVVLVIPTVCVCRGDQRGKAMAVLQRQLFTTNRLLEGSKLQECSSKMLDAHHSIPMVTRTHQTFTAYRLLIVTTLAIDSARY